MEDKDKLEKLHVEQTKLIDELRNTMESKKAESAEAKEKVEKLEKRLGEIEDVNQKMVKDLDAKNSLIEDLKSKYEAIEKAGLRLGGDNKTEEQKEHKRIFDLFVKQGKEILSPEEFKYLRTNNDASGGSLAPSDYLQEIQKNIVEISQFRQIARVRNTTKSVLEIPRRTAEPTGYWVGQAGSTTESESTYGMESIPVHKVSVYSIATREMLNDSAFDIESEIMRDAAEDMAQTEGAAFISGTGQNRPEGILVNATLVAGYRASGIADDIKADNLIDLAGDIKTGYNPVYICNRTTLAAIRKMKDGAGQYVWQSGLSAGLPNSINGYSYKEMPDMDSITTNTYPVAFGDFKKGYNIVDGAGLYVIRDEYSLATSGKIKFVFLKFLGGKVVVPEAIKLLKCSVS